MQDLDQTPDTPVNQLLHAMNSHLAVISGYTQLLEKKLTLSDEEAKWMATIAKECANLKNCIDSVKAKIAPTSNQTPAEPN